MIRIWNEPTDHRLKSIISPLLANTNFILLHFLLQQTSIIVRIFLWNVDIKVFVNDTLDNESSSLETNNFSVQLLQLSFLSF